MTAPSIRERLKVTCLDHAGTQAQLLIRVREIVDKGDPPGADDVVVAEQVPAVGVDLRREVQAVGELAAPRDVRAQAPEVLRGEELREGLQGCLRYIGGLRGPRKQGRKMGPKLGEGVPELWPESASQRRCHPPWASPEGPCMAWQQRVGWLQHIGWLQRMWRPRRTGWPQRCGRPQLVGWARSTGGRNA